MELSSSSTSSSRPLRPTAVNGGDRNHLNGGPLPPPPQKHQQQQPNGRQQNHHYTIDQNQRLPENHHRQQNLPENHYHRQNHSENHHRHDSGYYRRSSSSASVKGCCCCLFLLFSFIILLILAVVLTVILAVKPKKPQFDLQQVGVQYMGITAPNLNPADTSSSSPSASLSLTIRMLFTAVNPNKVGIKYRDSRFTVMYRGIPLGRATVPGFYQDAHSVRNVDATISVDRVNLLQANAADLIRDASLNDRIELTVFGDVGAKIRVMNFDSPGVQVSLNCFIVISPRKQALTSKQCGFDGLTV